MVLKHDDAISSENDEVVIKAENVSKKFSRSLRRSMAYGIKDTIRNILRISAKPDILRKDEFWAINDVSFVVKKGECLGIIGPNGAGKTSLLSILNGIYMPDKGQITIKGKTGALIAVGAGFHPMLTGRENIYINGAILGMSKEEIEEKFDDIVKFADIGDFLDSPVKNYSSGMFVRLGFSVAVHCEPEVLLIDEVLSVGDLAFQNKSLRRVSQVLENANAVVFVSHNLGHIRQLCDKVLILNNGKLVFLGKTHEALSKYHEMAREKSFTDIKNKKQMTLPGVRISSGDFIFGDAGILDEFGNLTEKIKVGKPLITFFEFEATRHFEELYFSVAIRAESMNINNCIWHISKENDKIRFNNISKGKYRLIVKFLTPSLVLGVYSMIFSIRNGTTNEIYERISDLKPFIIEGDAIPRGLVHTESEWKMESID